MVTDSNPNGIRLYRLWVNRPVSLGTVIFTSAHETVLPMCSLKSLEKGGRRHDEMPAFPLATRVSKGNRIVSDSPWAMGTGCPNLLSGSSYVQPRSWSTQATCCQTFYSPKFPGLLGFSGLRGFLNAFSLLLKIDMMIIYLRDAQ
jgi:hypothetical protein